MKVSDQFFYGEGRIEKNKVLVSGSINKSLEKELNHFGGCYLVNYKAKVEKIMPATNPGEFDYQKYYRSKKIKERVKLPCGGLCLEKGIAVIKGDFMLGGAPLVAHIHGHLPLVVTTVFRHTHTFRVYAFGKLVLLVG